MIDNTTQGIVSVWIGTSTQSLEDFNRYTEGMETAGSGCPAHKDFGCDFIDSDFFVAYGTAGNEIVPVEALVEEVDVSSNEAADAIVARCHELGIESGNSLYYWSNCTFNEEVPGRLYNELRFIGAFDDGSRKKQKKQKKKK